MSADASPSVAILPSGCQGGLKMTKDDDQMDEYDEGSISESNSTTSRQDHHTSDDDSTSEYPGPAISSQPYAISYKGMPLFQCIQCPAVFRLEQYLKQHHAVAHEQNVPRVFDKPQNRRPKFTRNHVTVDDKKRLLDEYDQLPKMSKYKAADILGIKRPFLYNLLSARDEIMSPVQNKHVKQAQHDQIAQ